MRPAATALLLALSGAAALAADFSWPTSMDASLTARPEDFAQPTVSGRISSALFGMTREEGRRFHEGIDIRPVYRDRLGEPTDSVLAAADGQVMHLNVRANGPYGVYVVLWHADDRLPHYTLYAHMARISPALKVGSQVPRGMTLGTLGRTADRADPIPQGRAHLHFEIGLLLSGTFTRWHDAQKENRGVKNLHGAWNGQNLIGLDPLPILRAGKADLAEEVRRMPAALACALRTAKAPDFALRHPALVEGDAAQAAGWRIEFTWHGLPKRWIALPQGSAELPKGSWSLVATDRSQKDLLVRRKMLNPAGSAPGELLIRQMGILAESAR
ncbi:MAG: M23 family metallopeptidase [Opitutales bacterium]